LSGLKVAAKLRGAIGLGVTAMSEFAITAGQTAVREHVQAMLSRDAEAGSSLEIRLEYAQELQARLASDRRVTCDAVTGRQLGRTPFASSYLGYLQHAGTTRDLGTGQPQVPIAGYIYTRTDLREPAFAFGLGVKYPSTAHALFGLAKGVALPERGWDLVVYEDYGAVMVGSGGNHRSLAHMLWGEPRVTTRSIKLVRAGRAIDDELNRALLFYEDATRGCTIGPSSIRDLSEIRRIFVESTHSEREILRAFMRDTFVSAQYLGMRSQGGLSFEVEELRAALSGLRKLESVRSRNFWFSVSRRRALEKLKREERILRWLDKVYNGPEE
jgi:hypothetical protein